MRCIVKLIWNDNEKFWHSESMDERFGLTLESGSLDVLIERVKMAVPEMFELIGYTGAIDLSFENTVISHIITNASQNLDHHARQKNKLSYHGRESHERVMREIFFRI